MAQTENDKFLFIHVLKTGGTSFTNILGTNFEDSQQYPEACLVPDADFATRMEAYMYLPTFLANVNSLGKQLKMVRAHVPYAVRNLLNHNYRVLTILRNPIDRTLSYLKHARKYHPEHLGMDLEDIYEDPWLNACFIKNYQTKIFSMSDEEIQVKNQFPSDAPRLPSVQAIQDGQALSEEITAFRESFPTHFLWGLFAPCTGAITVDNKRLATAKENLANLELVGVTEAYDRFLEQLIKKFGWKITSAPHLHAGEPDTTVSAAFRNRIADDCAFDMELYEYARLLSA